MATPQFILDLREKIGHSPLWLMGITAVVRDAQGRYLLGRRADTGEWAFTYGIVEPAEEPAITAIREVKEETGLDVEVTALVAVTSSSRMLTYANGDKAQYMDHMFEARLAPGSSHLASTPDGENLNSRWFAQECFPDNLAASTKERLALYKRWLAQGEDLSHRPALFRS